MDKRNKRIGKLLAALIAFGVLAGSGRTVLPVDAAQDAQTAQEAENADDSASYGRLCPRTPGLSQRTG